MDGTDLVGGSPKRVISMLLTNLGVRQKPPAKKPSLSGPVTYRPVDVSKVVNRTFTDPASGDSTGWLDWGPDGDLSSFPTGRVTLRGVPFDVPKGPRPNGPPPRLGRPSQPNTWKPRSSCWSRSNHATRRPSSEPRLDRHVRRR